MSAIAMSPWRCTISNLPSGPRHETHVGVPVRVRSRIHAVRLDQLARRVGTRSPGPIERARVINRERDDLADEEGVRAVLKLTGRRVVPVMGAVVREGIPLPLVRPQHSSVADRMVALGARPTRIESGGVGPSAH